MHLKSPNRWSCLPTSFAMAVNCEVKDIFDFVGHDGSAIRFNGLPEPFCRRGFHIQEMIDYCLYNNINVTQVEGLPTSANKFPDTEFQIWNEENCKDRMARYLCNYSGILVGLTKPSNKPHAVYWHDHWIFDPNGEKYDIDRFDIQSLYIVR